MKSLIQEKASVIYQQFSKAPILEMVQYMVNENVDAQVLHQLKLIDQKQHKNPHVISYGEKIYAAYERICKVLVTYPSLEFVDSKFKIKKNKESRFANEFFPNTRLNKLTIETILNIVNNAILYGIESTNDCISKINNLLKDRAFYNQLIMFLKEACGEDYEAYIKKLSKANLS